MPLLRLLLAGVFAIVAMGAALFAAVVMVVTTLLSALTGGKVRARVDVHRAGRPPGPGAARRPTPVNLSGTKGEVIDVEARVVPERRVEDSSL